MREPRISIHALLAESDGKPNKLAGLKLVFLSTLSLRRATRPIDVPQYQILISIHALLAESDVSDLDAIAVQAAFLSTLSLRRATGVLFLIDEIQLISIHALLAESDPKRFGDALKHLYFYPRSPCGERPRRASRQQPAGDISIHALLAESDMAAIRQVVSAELHFYPRSPCGERRYPLR